MMASSSATTGATLADQSVDAVQHEPSLTEAGKKAAQAEVDVERAGQDGIQTTKQPSKPQHDPEIPPLIRFLRRLHWHISYNPPVYTATPLLASLALLLPLILVAQRQSPDATECAARTTECGFEGNEDAYGFGIRLGVYLQWLASILIYIAIPSEERSSMAAMAIFSFSLLLAVIVLTFDSAQSCVFEIEIIVMLFIVFATQLILSVTHTGRNIWEKNEEAEIQATGADRGTNDSGPSLSDNLSDEKRPLKRVGTFMSSLGSEQGRFGWTVATGVIDLYSLTYLTWFWIRNAMPHASSAFAPTPCGTSIFLIGRIRGESSIRAASAFLAAVSAAFFASTFVNGILNWLLPSKQAARVRTIVALIVVAPLFLVAGIGVYLTLQLLKFMGRRARTEELSDEESDRKAEEHLFAGCLVTVVVVPITGIELSLVWNNVVGVYSISSTGQIIPFVIGLAGFLPICWKLCRRKLYHYHQQRRDGRSENEEGVEIGTEVEGEADAEAESEVETQPRSQSGR